MAKIERGLSALPDVTLARVNLTDRRVALEWKEGGLDPSRFIDRLAELGYKAYPFEKAGAENAEAEQSRFLLRCLGVAAFATMNVMMLSIPVWSGNVSDMLPEQRDFFERIERCAFTARPFPHNVVVAAHGDDIRAAGGKRLDHARVADVAAMHDERALARERSDARIDEAVRIRNEQHTQRALLPLPLAGEGWGEGGRGSRFHSECPHPALFRTREREQQA